MASTEATSSTPFVLDDFEATNRQPTDPRFGLWEYFVFPFVPEHSSLQYFTSNAALNSNQGSDFSWNLQPLQNGQSSSPGAGFRISAKPFIDLSGFSRMVLSHRYIPDPQCRPISQVRVALGCQELNGEIATRFDVATEWTVAVLNFEQFQPETTTPGATNSNVTIEDCLRAAGEFSFIVGTEPERWRVRRRAPVL